VQSSLSVHIAAGSQSTGIRSSGFMPRG
jgi:hypothetical protein